MGSPVDLDSYDWSRAGREPLTDDEIFQLTYAAQVEWGTQGTFESLNISDDPLTRQFLQLWLNQEVVHAEVLVRFLGACGVIVTPLQPTRHHRRGAQRGWRINELARRVVGDDFFAVHMTWSAVNELTTLRFYQQLRARTRNALLGEILRDLIAQEALHYRFYRAAAIGRLSENPRAQRLVRFAMWHLWSAVGVGLRSRADACRLLRSLFGDEPETIGRIGNSISSLPGLEALQLLARELEQDNETDRRVSAYIDSRRPNHDATYPSGQPWTIARLGSLDGALDSRVHSPRCVVLHREWSREFCRSLRHCTGEDDTRGHERRANRLVSGTARK